MSTPGTLRRRLGVRDAVVVGAGSMIGAGVFTAWGPAAQAAGDGMLLGLVLAGAVAFCNATSSAQLAALHPESGGTYVFARHRLGPAWSHLAGWGFVVGKTASCAAMALAVGAYAWPEHERAVGVVAVVLVAAVNLGGLRRTVSVTKMLLLVSLTTLATVVVVPHVGSDVGTLVVTTPIAVTPYGVVQAAGLLFFAFAGYARIATLGEEVREPEVTIPKAVPRALLAVLVVYLAVGASAVVAVPVETIAGSSAPLRDVLDLTGHGRSAHVVRIGATVASLGVLLNLIPGISRTVLAMARRGELPRVFSHVDGRRDLPVRAESGVVVVVAALVATVGLRSAIAVSGTAVLTYYAITNAAALRLSAEERRWPRWVAVVGLAGCVGLTLALPWRELAVGTAVLVVGATVRLATAHRGARSGDVR